MKIAKVFYDLFETDAQWLDENPDAASHELDREIRIEGEDGSSLYISWCWEPVQYAICADSDTHFLEAETFVREMTGSSMWADLIGGEAELKFLDKNQQVLQIGANGASVYCWTSAFEKEGLDVVYVSRQKPQPAA